MLMQNWQIFIALAIKWKNDREKYRIAVSIFHLDKNAAINQRKPWSVYCDRQRNPITKLDRGRVVCAHAQQTWRMSRSRVRSKIIVVILEGGGGCKGNRMFDWR